MSFKPKFIIHEKGRILPAEKFLKRECKGWSGTLLQALKECGGTGKQFVTECDQTVRQFADEISGTRRKQRR